jgi:hypothetical protein
MSDFPRVQDNVENDIYELTPAELDHVAGGLLSFTNVFYLGIGIGEIDLSSFGTNQPVNAGIGQNFGNIQVQHEAGDLITAAGM